MSHREPAAHVSDEDEAVVFQVAHHGVAAAQFCGSPVPIVIVADGAVTHHGQHVREDPLATTTRDDSHQTLYRTNT